MKNQTLEKLLTILTIAITALLILAQTEFIAMVGFLTYTVFAYLRYTGNDNARLLCFSTSLLMAGIYCFTENIFSFDHFIWIALLLCDYKLIEKAETYVKRKKK